MRVDRLDHLRSWAGGELSGQCLDQVAAVVAAGHPRKASEAEGVGEGRRILETVVAVVEEEEHPRLEERWVLVLAQWVGAGREARSWSCGCLGVAAAAERVLMEVLDSVAWVVVEEEQ